ncbi:B-cell receptor-associated protein 31 [Tripterygium wilfordii]|uniref:Endoplasmic reticulum transmembrane protein n=1 Tax=Tripterygium wilfordii TaxID=458696 RepID=A0A7J7BXN2_TRIWF|nr:uncharacterized protein LOC119991728 [Tripterygium wilfordii]KAF5726455.1 B-cell receptor-associated protein 31 [Tripterygium wilfordii]
MIQLLYTVIAAEMALILTLLFKTPLRKLVIMALDRVKRGRGPVMVKTVAATVFMVLSSSVYGMAKIQNNKLEAGALNPTDEILMARHMLESSLMVFLLFLSLMIDRLHHYIRELRLLRKTMEAAKKQNRGFEDGKNGNAEEIKAMGEEIASLRKKIGKLELDCEAKGKEAKTAQAEAEASRKQSEKLLLEYDHLVEDNQNLRNQLESIDQSSLQSNGKNM